MRIRTTLIGAGLAGALAATAFMPTAFAATKAKVFTDLQNFAAGEPDHIDPHLTSTLVGAQVAVLMFDSLTDTDENGTLVPAAAASWSDSGTNSKVWTFKVKRGLRFSNGESVLPSNFKLGWERATNKALASEVAYHHDPIESVVADDKNLTLTVTLKYSFSAFPAVVSHTVFSPWPKANGANLDASGKIEDTTKLIGNGPYRLKEAIKKQAGGSVKLVPNPRYTGRKPTLAEINFVISGNVDSAYAAFEAGQGLTASVPAGRFQEAAAKYGEVGLGPVLGTDYWGFNWEDPVVGGAKNLELRKAIVYAVDRDAISRTIYQGQRKPTYQLLPKGIPGRQEGVGLTAKRDLDAAKKSFEAWKAAGNKLDKPIRLSYNDGANWDKVAAIIQANLKEIGIDSELNPFPADGTYFSKMRKGEGQIIRAGWFADYITADNFLYPLLHSASIDGDNLERYKNTKFDDLVNQARTKGNISESSALYTQAEKLALTEDVVIMPTVVRASNIVFSSKVKNIKITPIGFVLYDQLTAS